MVHLRKAEAKDLPAVCRFYEEVCAAQATDAYGPDWHYGIYPSAGDLASDVREGVLLLTEEEGSPSAAAVLRAGEDPLYDGAPWQVTEGPIRVLHLFAVHPACRGRGLGREMLGALLALAAADHAAVRLDVVKGNLPAERLYRSMGFAFVEEREVFYEDTGLIRVLLFEYAQR